MEHLPRQTCLEAAIGDIINRSGCLTTDSDISTECCLIQQQYTYQKPITEPNSLPEPNYRFIQSGGNDEPKESVRQFLEPKFPNPDCSWYSPDKSYPTNDTWLYETLYSNSKCGGSSQSIRNQTYFEPETERFTLVPFQHTGPACGNDSGISQTENTYSSHRGTEFSYSHCTNYNLPDSGQVSGRELVYSTPLRQKDAEREIRAYGSFASPTRSDAVYKVSSLVPLLLTSLTRVRRHSFKLMSHIHISL